ncbi:NAD-dependent aldehyde dehydrogenase family protein (macronuclear) [Tetrahymena thermophila SB210]|uniref:NAD-dependent aldehyde dehydrogenase family protein n=1 Tax=Tetrahymena thermophila (strain SB210) TaxID=312017 RepID=I7M123_TETTS|nr:NAD-dependent aldehyde dehydrogenase family protein [Tetrahymena thermophila SB210]EAR93884.1 NAD-dependent aldehyde dehydrogenase family protein [Tetrahymena thermophila SB210]|eukprot:XP_001014129.1 NAD-dependent aldehyde dehydrogenase family protein [Tetrahymena thermophila SB210]
MSKVYQKPTKFQTKLFINGKFVDGALKKTIPVINPATEELICEIAEATEQDVELAIDAAEASFPIWSKLPQRDRTEYLLKLASLLEANKEEFIALESLDNGKPLEGATFDINDVIGHLRYYAGWADKITGKSFSSLDQQIFYTRREPYGVVGLISPWNFPLMMAEWKYAPALAAGNCIVLKPSEVTPLTVLRLCELVNEAGFPPGVFNVVPGYGHVAGVAITHSKRISKISFTGSSFVGRKILEASSQTNLKKVVLELGGKSPVVVFPDADLDKAAEVAWYGCMFNMGQSCDAGTRLFVHEDVYDKLLQKLKEYEQNVVIGDSFEVQNSNHGPLVSKLQFDRVMSYITHAKEVEKLQCFMGGERWGNKGYFIKPTIFINVDDNSKLAREEIFGPVLVVLKPWKTFDEVIKRANDTNYGLAAYAVTQNAGNVEKFVREVKAGSFYINQGALSAHQMPFGGYKESGFGKDNGEEGLLEYTQLKSVYYSLPNPMV